MFYIMAGAGFVFLLRIWQKLNKIDESIDNIEVYSWLDSLSRILKSMESLRRLGENTRNPSPERDDPQERPPAKGE